MSNGVEESWSSRGHGHEAIAPDHDNRSQARAQSRKETGCASYEVLQDASNPEIFLLVEEWTSVAALDAHNQDRAFP